MNPGFLLGLVKAFNFGGGGYWRRVSDMQAALIIRQGFLACGGCKLEIISPVLKFEARVRFLVAL